MDKSSLKISHRFVGFLLICFLLMVIWGLLLPAGTPKIKVIIIRTRTEERVMSSLLEDQAMKVGGLTNISGQFILATLSAMDEFGTNRLFRTNISGEVIDVSQTPYRIELIAPTNFIIRSAGKDKTFGDADDIIFNSVSNDFVKP
jgi:predicted small integral membrane protein